MVSEGQATVVQVGTVYSCYPERFGVPRQPGLVPSAEAELHLEAPWNDPTALQGLEGFSHVWLLYGFHANPPKPWRPTVRPPRLGGNRRMGVFATRSPFRPSPLGLSVARLVEVVVTGVWQGLRLADHDLVDGTPVYDIKPYLPWSDALSHAHAPSGFARPEPGLAVSFEAGVLERAPGNRPDWRALVTETLAQDPRPAFHRDDPDRLYGVALGGYNVRFRVAGATAVVFAVVPR